MKKRIKDKLMLHHLLFHHFLKTTRFLKQEKSRLKRYQNLYFTIRITEEANLNEEMEKECRREIKPLPLVNQYYFYDRDTWNPLSDNVISTKRARGFGAFSVSILRIRTAACGSFATIYKYPPPPAPGNLYPKV